MTDKPHLSHSSIKTYMDCGLLYKFSRIDRLPPEFVSDNLLFGSALHKAMAEFNLSRLSGEKLSLNDLIQSFESHWEQKVEKNLNDIVYSKDKNYQILLQEGRSLLKAFYESSDHDSYSILAVEEPFQIELSGVDYPIVGYIDLVEEDESGTIIITEYKSSKKAYSTDEVNRNQQLTLYSLAMRENGYKDREILLKIDALIKTRTPKFKQFYTMRSPWEEQRIIRKIQEVCKGIQNKVFIPNDDSWRCQNCEYRGYCKEWCQGERL